VLVTFFKLLARSFSAIKEITSLDGRLQEKAVAQSIDIHRKHHKNTAMPRDDEDRERKDRHKRKHSGMHWRRLLYKRLINSTDHKREEKKSHKDKKRKRKNHKKDKKEKHHDKKRKVDDDKQRQAQAILESKQLRSVAIALTIRLNIRNGKQIVDREGLFPEKHRVSGVVCRVETPNRTNLYIF